jgi:hypothetical protein
MFPWMVLPLTRAVRFYTFSRKPDFAQTRPHIPKQFPMPPPCCATIKNVNPKQTGRIESRNGKKERKKLKLFQAFLTGIFYF